MASSYGGAKPDQAAVPRVDRGHVGTPAITPPSRASPGWPCGASWRTACALLAVLGYAAVLRTANLGDRPFWVDEAESCINALTILDHGLPVDHYLGLPIHENTFTRPWPDHPEFEFKDTSYSRKGLAIYHGWLPLYSIAAAFAAAGIGPDSDADALSVRHSAEAIRRRTAVGRVPSVMFGLAFLVLAFLGAKEMYGADAGWVALVTATLCTPVIEFAREARYYAATLALTTLCCLMIWRMLGRGGWRDFLVGGVAFGLLFHAHMLSFVVACAACTLVIPFMFAHPAAVRKMVACGTIVALAVFPWTAFSGFLGATSDIPSARSMLIGPDDYLAYPRRQRVYVCIASAALVCLLVLARVRHRLPSWLVRPFAHRMQRRAFYFLAAWSAIGFVAFLLLMPAASFFYKRLTLMLMAPGVLFGAILFASVGRVFGGFLGGRLERAAPVVVGTGLFLLALAAQGKVTLRHVAPRVQDQATYDIVELLRARGPFRPGTRLYATPNYHLPMTFYTGLPVANVGAVRKSFLDTYPGEVIVLEAGPYYDWLTWGEIRAEAARHGFEYTDEQMWTVEPLVNSRLVREALVGAVAEIWPPLEPSQPYYAPLLRLQREKTREGIDAWISADGNPMFWGYRVERYTDWWPVFFYRFVGVEQRSGRNLHYAGRIRDAHATVMPQGWTVFHSPARPGQNPHSATGPAAEADRRRSN